MFGEKEKIIRGKIVAGRGEAKGFMQVDWVRRQCLYQAGFDPFPGTLNLLVSAEDFNFIRRLCCALGKRLTPPAGVGDFCEARLLEGSAGDIKAAVVFPMVDNYYSDIVEIIAPVPLREYKGIKEGDYISFLPKIPEKLPAPSGIIFDLDGTLLDSIDLYYSILCEGCRSLGLEEPAKEKVLKIMGSGISFWEALNELFAALELPEGIEAFREKGFPILEEIWRRRYDEEIRFFQGVPELLKQFYSAGIKMGIVTSSFYEKKLQIFTEQGLEPFSLFCSIITRLNSCKNKPDPEPMLRCLQKLNKNPERCLCVGDSPCDIISGREAGMFTVGVLTGTGTRQSLSKEGADMILDSVTDLTKFFDLKYS